MKKVGNPNSISRILQFSLALMLTFTFQLFAQDAASAAAPATADAAPAAVVSGDPAAGKALFNAQCAACHKLDAKMTGPALRGVG
ncbi:MAG TPA: cytochrome c, partial [Flavobacterium sp.]|nr:cytochrome c [Flavobacterium sp.]